MGSLAQFVREIYNRADLFPTVLYLRDSKRPVPVQAPCTCREHHKPTQQPSPHIREGLIHVLKRLRSFRPDEMPVNRDTIKHRDTERRLRGGLQDYEARGIQIASVWAAQ